MKKLFVVALAFFFVGFIPLAFAQGFVPLAVIPGLTDVQPNAGGLASFFNNLYKYLIGLSAVIAIIMIIWGGLQYATQDIPGEKRDGKERIQQAILGLILVLSPVLVFSIINPAILNLSINLPALNTRSGPPTGATPNQSTVDSTSGCSVRGTPGILQIATCPSESAADTWAVTCTAGNLSKTSTTNPTNGVRTTTVICAGRQQYTFLYNNGSGSATTHVINRLQPLVSASDRAANATEAMNFASTCGGAGLGLYTCVDRNPVVLASVPCGFTTTYSCYKETLSCENTTLNSALLPLCSASPSWTPVAAP